MMKAEVLCDALCIVGESPLWDSRRLQLYMVDIQGKRLRTIDWNSAAAVDRVLPLPVGFLVPGQAGELLGGSVDGVYRLDGGRFDRLSAAQPLKGERFNDGKVGPDGRLYLGTFSRDYSAAFYRMEPDGALTELFDGVGNSNGLAWDATGTRLYYNDTPTGRTDCFTRQPDGAWGDRRPVCHYAAGNPDGMTIDRNGNLWVALWGSGTVVCVEPDGGKIVETIALPVSQPSSCTFAGAGLDTLVITTAAHGVHLRDEPLAGSVFAVQPGVQGLEPEQLCCKSRKE